MRSQCGPFANSASIASNSARKLLCLQTRGGAGQDQARHWAEVVAARNAEQQRLTAQMQAGQTREASLEQQLSASQRSCSTSQVRKPPPAAYANSALSLRALTALATMHIQSSSHCQPKGCSL